MPHGRLLEGPEGHALYKNTTDELLEMTATLDDTKKVNILHTVFLVLGS